MELMQPMTAPPRAKLQPKFRLWLILDQIEWCTSLGPLEAGAWSHSNIVRRVPGASPTCSARSPRNGPRYNRPRVLLTSKPFSTYQNAYEGCKAWRPSYMLEKFNSLIQLEGGRFVHRHPASSCTSGGSARSTWRTRRLDIWWTSDLMADDAYRPPNQHRPCHDFVGWLVVGRLHVIGRGHSQGLCWLGGG